MKIEGDDLQPILMAMNYFTQSHIYSESMGSTLTQSKECVCFHCEYKNKCLTKNDNLKVNNHCETLKRRIEKELDKSWKK